MKNIYKVGLNIVFLLSLLSISFADAFEPAASRTEAIKKFEELRYGIWGSFASKKAVNYDIDQCLTVLKNAGIKYVVFVAKEGGGYCFWHSKYTTYGLNGDNKIDVLAEFAKKCPEYGIVLGLSYCYGRDDYHQGQKGMEGEKYFTFAKNQLRELLTNYGPIAEMWITGEAGAREPKDLKDVRECYDTIKSVQPDCLVSIHGAWDETWPTDILQPGEDMPPVEGYNPYRNHNGKTYYVPFEPYLSPRGDWPRKDETLPIIHHEITSRGSNVILIAGGVDEDGRIHAKTVNMLLSLGEGIKRIPDRKALHKISKKTVSKVNDKEYIEITGKGSTDPMITGDDWGHVFRRSISRFYAISSAEKQMFSIIKEIKLENGITIGEAVKSDQGLSDKITTEIQSAEIISTDYKSDDSCTIIMRLDKLNLKKLIGVE